MAALSPASAYAVEPVDSPGFPLSASSAVEITLGLGLVVGAIILCAWLVRRVFRISPGVSRHMKIVAGLALGTRERIVLLQVGETQLLVGVSPGRIQTLHVLDKPLSLTDEASSASFGGELRRFLKPAERAENA